MQDMIRSSFLLSDGLVPMCMYYICYERRQRHVQIALDFICVLKSRPGGATMHIDAYIMVNGRGALILPICL